MKRSQPKQPKLEGSIDIRRAAMDLLARREHSRKELVDKLCGRVENPSDLDDALDRLIEENLLSDQRYCEAFVLSRKNKGYGPVRIKHELRERGVDQTLIDTYLDESSEAWITSLQKVIIKKYGDFPDDGYQQQVKKKRFLLQRGFTFEQIQSAINSLTG